MHASHMLPVLIILLLSPVIASAETQFIAKDNVEVRAGAGLEQPVEKLLSSGTEVSVTFKKKPDWVLIELADGSTGWIKQQDITAQSNNRGIKLSSSALSTIADSAVKRVALVIGNAGYEQLGALNNPRNDAEDISAELRKLNFEVVTALDADRSRLASAINEFESKLTPGGVAFFYYAGHGIQVDGENYLVPVNSGIVSEEDVRFRAVAVSDVLRTMKKVDSYLNVIILDACRNNNLRSATRSATRGLAKIANNAIPNNYLVSYATQPNDVAQDGEGRNGLYTKHLLRELRQSKYHIKEVLDNVAANVIRETNEQQRPEYLTGFFEKYYLHGAPAAGAQAGSGPVNKDLELWLKIKESRDITEFENYLRLFPAGIFVNEANASIARLQEEQTLLSGPDFSNVPDDAVIFKFSEPRGAKVEFDEKRYTIGDNLFLFFKKGENKVTIYMPNGRRIYGSFDVLVLDDAVKEATFGATEDLPKIKHISAAMRGSPVRYTIGMPIKGKNTKVLKYRLSLRPM